MDIASSLEEQTSAGEVLIGSEKKAPKPKVGPKLKWTRVAQSDLQDPEITEDWARVMA